MVLSTLVCRGRVRSASKGTHLKKHNRDSKESPFTDPDFAEALYEDKSGNLSLSRKAQRKTLQFCRQVQRALNLALEDRNIGDGSNDVYIEEVCPAPDCGHLRVHVLIPGGMSAVDVMCALGREAPRLRSEIASAISRKRAPELCFVPALQDGANDE
jgi:ribosome-binding factor A